MNTSAFRSLLCTVACATGLLFSSACGDDVSPPLLDAGVDSAALCTSDGDCSDGAFCSGTERCQPSAVGADARGCVSGSAPCVSGQICSETADTCVTDCVVDRDADGDASDATECGGDDCDDANATRYPGAAETCDPGNVDEDCNSSTYGLLDEDGDGETSSVCCNGAICGTDCNDRSIAQRSGQPEFCDTTDNDCDGTPDDMTIEVPWYADGDGDGFGAASSTPMSSCAPIPGRSLLANDCDDTDPQVSRVGIERCSNGKDDDCDGSSDAADSDCITPPMDGGMADGGSGMMDGGSGMMDGGAMDGGVAGCEFDTDCLDVNPCMVSRGCVGGTCRSDVRDMDGDGVPPVECGGTDCDDTDPNRFPGNAESCNGVDEDCDNTTLGSDVDGDTFVSTFCCNGPSNCGTDCDDSLDIVNPGAVEVCNGNIDDNCNGIGDEGC